MEKFILAVQDWPVLIQGAIGSAIFWLVLLVGQRGARYCAGIIRTYSKDKQETYLRNEFIRYNAVREGGSIQIGGAYAAMLWYRASRNVIVGLIWLSLGLIFGSVVSVFGIVGFFGCIYHLFGALNIVGPINHEGDVEKKIAEIAEKLARLEEPNKGGKSSEAQTQ